MTKRCLLLALLVFSAALRLWRLDQNGFGFAYYSAGVRSMLAGWRNVFYNAFDPAGFVSVDKPPVALWVQAASARLLGFHGLAVLVPQVLEGVAAVWLVHHLVRRRFGTAAGLLAGLFLAVTPISVAIDRSSNTDSCLVLVLLLAAWALTRAAERASRGLLLLSMALIGLGFNVKMLAAWVVLPTFAAIYLAGAPAPWRKRLVDLTLGGLVLAAVSLSWMLAYDLTPADRRPFAGSSKSNSMLELAIRYNGLGRFIRQGRAPRTAALARGAGPAAAPEDRPGVARGQGAAPGDRPGAAAGQPDTTEGAPPDRLAGTQAGPARREVGGILGMNVPTGPLRLADRMLAGQFAWLVPLALAGLAIGALRSRWRWPLDPAHQDLALWTGWAVTYGVVYSWAGGIFHAYYLATMAPPLAALAAIGVVGLWREHRAGGWRTLLPPGVLLLTAAWQRYVQSVVTSPDAGPATSWLWWLSAALACGVLVAVAGLLVARLPALPGVPAMCLGAGALAVGILALLVTPTAWVLSSVLVRGSVAFPAADLSRLVSLADVPPPARVQSASPVDTDKLVGFLRANRRGERFLLATSSSQLAAPIIVETGEPVMAMGGYFGLDPILTPESLAQMVAAGHLRFVIVGDVWGLRRRLGVEAAGRELAEWVRANGQPVDPALWRAVALDRTPADDSGRPSPAALRAYVVRRMLLYDLRPESGLVPGR